MEQVWQLLISGNVFLLAIVAWVFHQLGNAASQNSPASRVWGKRIGFGVFIAFFGVVLANVTVPNATSLVVVTIRGLIIAWFAGTVALVTLPLVFWFDSQIRAQRMSLQAAATARREKIEAQRKARESEARRKIEQEEWERNAPEREQAERVAAARQEVERKQRQSAQKRREDVRSQLELVYTLYAPKIRKRFSQEMFDNFEAKYMGDDRAPEEVEERGRQLLGILEQHHNAVVQPQKYSSLEELANWFVAEQRRLDSVELDEFLKDEFRTLLHDRYSELSQKFLQTMQP